MIGKAEMRHTPPRRTIFDREPGLKHYTSPYIPRCDNCNQILGISDLGRNFCSNCRIEFAVAKHKREKTRNKKSRSGFIAVLKTRIASTVARQRKKGWNQSDITMSFLLELYDKQNGKCALSGQDLSLGSPNFREYDPNVISIDRKDSTKGYTRENVQFVTLQINRAKGAHTDEEFVEMCKRVTDYHSNQKTIATDASDSEEF